MGMKVVISEDSDDTAEISLEDESRWVRVRVGPEPNTSVLFSPSAARTVAAALIAAADGLGKSG